MTNRKKEWWEKLEQADSHNENATADFVSVSPERLTKTQKDLEILRANSHEKNPLFCDEWGNPIDERKTNKIRVSSVLERIEKNKKITFSIRSNAESIAKIKAFAKARGIPYQTLINATIDEFADSLD